MRWLKNKMHTNFLHLCVCLVIFLNNIHRFQLSHGEIVRLVIVFPGLAEIGGGRENHCCDRVIILLCKQKN